MAPTHVTQQIFDCLVMRTTPLVSSSLELEREDQIPSAVHVVPLHAIAREHSIEICTKAARARCNCSWSPSCAREGTA